MDIQLEGNSFSPMKDGLILDLKSVSDTDSNSNSNSKNKLKKKSKKKSSHKKSRTNIIRVKTNKLDEISEEDEEGRLNLLTS